jgi:hypothetical protein
MTKPGNISGKEAVKAFKKARMATHRPGWKPSSNVKTKYPHQPFHSTI